MDGSSFIPWIHAYSRIRASFIHVAQVNKLHWRIIAIASGIIDGNLLEYIVEILSGGIKLYFPTVARYEAWNKDVIIFLLDCRASTYIIQELL